MRDVFETLAIREHIAKVGFVMLLCGLALLGSYLPFSTVVQNGRVLNVEVLRLGTYPTGGVAGGNLPILTVKLPDGSTREVEATWADVDHCAPGRWINLVQSGSALQVGKPGCSPKP